MASLACSHSTWHGAKEQPPLEQYSSCVIVHNPLPLAFSEWRSAYEESIKKHGSVSVAVTRSIFVGPPEAGKSTLKHLLVHNTPKAVKTSTAVMDTPDVVSFSSEQYTVGETTSAWQLVNSDVMMKALHACISNEAYEEKVHYPTEMGTEETEDVEEQKDQKRNEEEEEKDQYPSELGSEEADDERHEAVVEEQKDGHPLPKQTEQDQSDIASLDEQYDQLFYEMEGEGKQIELKDASFIHLLDTGGQPSFQDVLPLLLDVPCTYIQVFNAAHSLDERVPITYRFDDHTTERSEDAEPGRDMIQRSFSSMQTMAQKCSKQLASFQQEQSPLPKLRIFVVGTRKDQLIKEGRLDEATQDITTFLEELDGKPYYHSIEWDSSTGKPFFLIDTIADKDDRASVSHLRECLSSEGSSLKLNVPVVWFFCQEITRSTKKKFFRLQDLEAFCQKHKFVGGENAASQFRALLQLFSLLGFYSFFNLEGVSDKDNFVCTDTGVFLREVSKLLAVQFVKPKGAGMAGFKNTGILSFTPKLFQELEMSQEMNPHWFLGALQHLGIAAQLQGSYKDQLEYFIPAVLPQSSAIQDPPSSVAPLCFTYIIKEGAVSSYSDMPRGVFCRLAVELIRQKWRIKKKESSRTLLKYRWQEFMIFLKESPGLIGLIPQVVEILPLSDLHTRCEVLLDTITDCLSISTEAVLGSNFNRDELAVGFECPCKEVDMPHLAVPSETGNSLDCHETDDPQTYTNKQRIWFSPVDGVEVSSS